MAAALNSVSSTEKMRGRERGKGRGGCACPSPHVPGAPSPLQALVVQGGVDGTNFDSGLRPELRRLTNSRRRAPPPRAHSASRGPPLLRGPERCLELFCPYTWSASAEGQTMQLQAQTILLVVKALFYCCDTGELARCSSLERRLTAHLRSNNKHV
ncbi:unnamed protein product [Triticum turgidum subsp. durum]|uniref:Uncharacterized protein n=1 Tax=Triticum turgidum subsp. durum TaxID=4567 RepID=A0A9R0QX70_TRITD|nr:unnamed protein product [Triticum turgidum subsp. durum]